MSSRVQSRLSAAHLFLKQHEEAVTWGRRAIRVANLNWPAYGDLISALGHLGRADEARRVHQELKKRHSDITLTLTFVREHQYGVLDADYLSHYLEGLRRSGVPE